MTAAARQRSAALRRVCLLVAGLALTVGAGCGAEDQPARSPEKQTQATPSVSDPAAVYCQRHIDELIAADIVPAADRDYATGMCVTQQAGKAPAVRSD